MCTTKGWTYFQGDNWARLFDKNLNIHDSGWADKLITLFLVQPYHRRHAETYIKFGLLFLTCLFLALLRSYCSLSMPYFAGTGGHDLSSL